jgi:DNA-binding NtrC family response regulator
MNENITYRILIFDDDQSIRDLLWNCFDHRGYEVFTFPHPRSCPICELHECQCPLNAACTDLIISDLNMPFVRGLDFLEQQISKGCKVRNLALMTGELQNADRARADRLGIRVFEKPFRIADIEKWADEAEAAIPVNRKLSDWYLGRK